MAYWPALDIRDLACDLALAIADDFSPTAAEEHADGITIFFGDNERRRRAKDAIARAHPTARVVPRDVDDEDWARRSQADFQPVTVGRITVAPPWAMATLSALPSPVIVIQPSMGFGTGHHATTRLCLSALQALELNGRSVVDVGTGSGVLALAARRLGASSVLGIDCDPDAIRSAEENLRLNPGVDRVRFEVADASRAAMPVADVVLANLTGAHLTRLAPALTDAVAPGGFLVASGLLRPERDVVVASFERSDVVSEGAEDEWLRLVFRRRVDA